MLPKLPPINWGPPKLWKWVDELLVPYYNASRLIRGEGYELNETPGGVQIVLDGTGPSGGASGGGADHPFKVTMREKEAGGFEASVSINSSLYKSLRPNDRQTITGLDTWFDLLANDAIWLGVVFNTSGVPTSASIDSWGQSNVFNIDELAWSGNDGYCEDDGGSPAIHQASRLLIAYTVADGDGNPVLTQKVTTDIVIKAVVIDNRPAKYLFPTAGGYPF